ncbi:MAG: 4-hydroxy-tetrahydrodipicolinate reductase [Dokdonella sp.]|nr:MAG: 4-hydroxy-tetrahydrodipicolinate reductase [Dokdonella sp.]
MPAPIPVIIHGASGRMGQALLRMLAQFEDLRLAAALVHPGSALLGQRVDPLRQDGPCYATTLADAVAGGVMVDFSVAGAFDAGLALARAQGLALVSGTTGLDARQRSALQQAARDIPVLWSANFSIGIAVLTRVLREAARALPQWDCEIVEAHHARSGTQAPRAVGQIGFAAVRAGDIVGEHEVLLAGAGERIELAHRASDRGIFARGALVAARWLATRPAGCYDFDQVIGEATP